ncbi:MAG: hypothetical protein U0R51_03840 [Solirubrobacterales bacterium]
MRKALNENPIAQIGVIAVAAIAFAIILFTMVLGKSEPDPNAVNTEGPAMMDPGVAPEAAGTTGATGAAPATSEPVAPADGTETPATGTETAPATPAVPEATPTAPPAGGSIADGLLPSKGLPQDLLVAFAKNKTIALLVIDPKGVADKKIEAYTEALKKRGDVEVFVVDVKDIARYSRVTAGVNVSRTPALVIVRPRKLTGSVPTATVSYGFRGAQSVNQAVDDALYKGKQIPSYP